MTDTTASQAARDERAPDGRTLALILENTVVVEAAQQIRYIRRKLKVKADSPKGLSGRTLVEGETRHVLLTIRDGPLSGASLAHRTEQHSCSPNSEASLISGGSKRLFRRL
jgi:hypothetical protein